MIRINLIDEAGEPKLTRVARRALKLMNSFIRAYAKAYAQLIAPV